MESIVFFQTATAFVLASAITWLNLITDKYPRTWTLFVWKSSGIWLYALTYGVLAAVLFCLLTFVIDVSELSITIQSRYGELKPPAGWTLSIIIGVFIKTFLKFNLFTYNFGKDQIPVGLEWLSSKIENYFTRTIEIDEFRAVKDTVKKSASHYQNFSAVKSAIKKGIPKFHMDQAESEAFEWELDKNNNIEDALELYLRTVGPKLFKSTFFDM